MGYKLEIRIVNYELNVRGSCDYSRKASIMRTLVRPYSVFSQQPSVLSKVRINTYFSDL